MNATERAQAKWGCGWKLLSPWQQAACIDQERVLILRGEIRSALSKGQDSIAVEELGIILGMF